VEADLHEVYGIDADDAELMRSRSWRWLRSRVLSLLDRPPTLLPVKFPARGKTITRIVSVPSTRIGHVINPPDLSPPDDPAT